MPASVPRIAATVIAAVDVSGVEVPATTPTRPKAAKPMIPIHGRRAEAHPSAAPASRLTTTMPVMRAALSLVPKRFTATSLSVPAVRSMKREPTAVISDGPLLAIAPTSSVTANATPAATTPATAAHGPEGPGGDDRGPEPGGRSATAVTRAPPAAAR